MKLHTLVWNAAAQPH